MGKAGILEGGKGDIMIPSSHIFEGTADNYPFKNELKKEDLEGMGVGVYDGAMISVLGTSLQNKDFSSNSIKTVSSSFSSKLLTEIGNQSCLKKLIN